jgi:uncharacterized cupin superfamily protein
MAKNPVAPALDPSSLEPRVGSGYPAPYDEPCRDRLKRALGEALGLTKYGVNLVQMPPGAWSSQRHWHSHEDEFVYVLQGELTLVTDDGEQVLGPGMAAGFPSGKADGHHLVNKTEATAVYLEVGDRSDHDETRYPDIDLFLPKDRPGFTRKNGEPY